MLKIISADLYKSFHRPYLYVFTGIFSALAIFFNIIFTAHSSAAESFKNSTTYLICLPFFAVMIVDIILAEENKFSTLKNAVSSGLGRYNIYFGKFITTLIITAVCAGVTFLIYLGSAFLLLDTGKSLSSAFMCDYLQRILIAMLLVAAALSVAMVFAVVFQKNSVYAFTFTGALFIPALLFHGLSFKWPAFGYLYEATIFGQTYSIKDIPAAHFYIPILVAVVHIVIFSIIGAVLFRRQEVK